MVSSIPVLLTWDVDPSPEDPLRDQKAAFNLVINLIRELKIQMTFFFTAKVAPDFKEEISLLSEMGQEIGCHGLTHGDEEEYNKMPELLQRTYLHKATCILSDLTNKQIKAFRAPRVKTSHITQKILEELGYLADCSVCSQRLDFLSSNIINFGWLLAPRLPYHPHERNAFRKGKCKIWVIPISALIAPFISNTLYVFKVNFMKCFFDILYNECRHSGKPVVYLAHPSDFIDNDFIANTELIKKSRSSFFKNMRVHGLSFRTKLYEKNIQKRYEMNRALFDYIRSHHNIKFMTVSEFIITMLTEITHQNFA